MSPSREKNRYPCQDYLRGNCQRGAACRQWHIPMCRFYKRGTCGAGDDCIYLHEDPKVKPALPAKAPRANSRGGKDKKTKAEKDAQKATVASSPLNE